MAIPSLENVTVAANGDDDCVGFVVWRSARRESRT